jgi:predicted N-formylglutamate amidohydrolase
MMSPAIVIEESAQDLLLIADHASNYVPPELQLGVAPELLNEHVALDVGVAPLAESLCGRLGCAGILGGVSRLVIDLNRELDTHGLIPAMSDGRLIPGNRNLSEEARHRRIAEWWEPYHRIVEERIASTRPKMLISLHSFTPKLSSDDVHRPWQVGVLYNEDERAARIAIPLLEERGVVTGDNQPYSGKVLNATMNRHAEGNGIPYLGLEVRQDLLLAPEAVAEWCAILAPVIAATAESLA